MMKSCLFSITCAAALAAAGCGRVETNVQAKQRQAAKEEPDRITLPAGSPKLSRIRVELVRTGSFALREVVVPGKVEVNPNRISRVLMPVGGRVREVIAKLGDTVNEGQPVIAIESSESGARIAAYRQSQAQMRQARSAQGKAQADVSRLRDLYEHRAAALKDVTAAENELVQAQGAVEQAQAGADESLHSLRLLGLDPERPSQDLLVHAPIGGKVLEIAVAPGEFRNDTSASLMTIADLQTVWIAAQVPEADIRLIDVGEAVSVQLTAYPDETFRARVTRIADTVDPQTRTVKVWAEMANSSGRLRPEMFGQIRHAHPPQKVPAVPVGAVIETNGRSIVLVEQSEGIFEERSIQPGPRRDGLIPVLGGLKAGERVVVDGVMLLYQPEGRT